MNRKIPLFKIYWDREDLESVCAVIRSGMHWAEGQDIRQFENKIAKYIGIKHCVVFNSGTSALHSALLAYGIKTQDEVIVPSFTFIATANAPLFVGAKPVFADIEEETFGLNPEDVRKKITSKTKAIIPVHYGGSPCKIIELRKIAKEFNLILIEDAAESFGAKLGNIKVGNFGDAAMFSFCQNKIITTGEGGAIVTNSESVYEKLKLIRSHGRSDLKNYFSTGETLDYLSLGYNFRMPSFLAALGISQLNKVNRIIEMRRANANYITVKLKQGTKDVLTLRQPKGYFNVYQLYTIIVKKDRDALKKYLGSKGITTKVYFPPVHLTKVYRNRFKQTRLPVTEKLSKEVLSLPIYPTLKREEVDYIIKEIKSFFKERK